MEEKKNAEYRTFQEVRKKYRSTATFRTCYLLLAHRLCPWMMHVVVFDYRNLGDKLSTAVFDGCLVWKGKVGKKGGNMEIQMLSMRSPI
jgi:hypothetical protein